MIIDGLTMVGFSINGYRLGVEELLASMNSNGIDRAVIAPFNPRLTALSLRTKRWALHRCATQTVSSVSVASTPDKGKPPLPSCAVACCA